MLNTWFADIRVVDLSPTLACFQPWPRVRTWLEWTGTFDPDKSVIHDAITGMHETWILDIIPGHRVDMV